MKRCTLDAYVIDTLMPDLVLHERSPSAFLVYVTLWRAAAGRRAAVRRSHQSLALASGLSKSAVQSAVRILVRRRLVRMHRPTTTAVPEYQILRPWRRPLAS